MSIWGAGVADNDDAADWLGEFWDEPSVLLLNDAFDDVLGGSDYLEVTEGSAAIAAAQIVAELFGKGGKEPLLEDEDEDAVRDLKKSLRKMHASAKLQLVERAIRSVVLVAYGTETSELHQLVHEDAELAQDWLKSIQGLEKRLMQVKNKLVQAQGGMTE